MGPIEFTLIRWTIPKITIKNHESPDLMKNNRPLLPLFFSACLLWTPYGFSKDDSASFTVATNASTVIPLAMLSGAQSELQAVEVTGPTDVQESVQQSEDTSQPPVAEKLATTYFSDEQLAHFRQLFLQAEESIKSGKDAEYFKLAEQLTDYPLYPYLQYQWLKKHLDHEPQVKQFLEQYSTSRYSPLLKHKWLYHLARKQQWPTFLEYYSTTSDTSLNCYHHIAEYKTGDKQAALNGAAKLWAVGHSQPKACDQLFASLKKSSLYNQDLLWQRFDAALRNNKVSLASYVKNQMAPTYQAAAQLWLDVHRKPERYIPELLAKAQTEQTPLMFVHAINRLASTDINRAIELWDQNKDRFDISKNHSDRMEKQLAFKLALKNETGAYERLGQLNASDSNTKAWRIRVALYDQNWPRVITAIQDLSDEDQHSEKWQYWLARAYLETGKTDEAEQLLTSLSTKRDFYGYLAADRVNSLYQLDDNPIKISSQKIEDIKNRDAFRVAFELMVLDRENEAKLQWWHALRSLNENEIIAAAKLAQKWQWDEIAIFTIAKVEYWDDIEMRFPLSYADKIHENAVKQNLNPAIIFGLVRRESAFNKNARSATGAQGLMQIMPKTGKQIARDLNERWTGKDSLYNPVKNLKYGSYYYQKLLNQFDGHYALALAAYNAGPNKVKQWLPDETTPADIWIETIPYSETRDYVTSVLAYTLIYQQRTNSNELTMNDFTRDVKPLQ
jgi:soluble lytic murein transglycosylase